MLTACPDTDLYAERLFCDEHPVVWCACCSETTSACGGGHLYWLGPAAASASRPMRMNIDLLYALSAGASASAEQDKSSSAAPSGWFRPFSMLGAGRKAENEVQAGHKAGTETRKSTGSSQQPTGESPDLSAAASSSITNRVQQTSSDL